MGLVKYPSYGKIGLLLFGGIFLMFVVFTDMCSSLYVAQPSSNPSTTEFNECLRKKKPMMDVCLPECEADKNLQGQAFDSCLDACAMKEFGKPIPVCAPLLQP